MCGIHKICRRRLAGEGVGPFDADAGNAIAGKRASAMDIGVSSDVRHSQKSVGAGLLAKASVRLASMPLTSSRISPAVQPADSFARSLTG
jgi:hypothetical protein